VDGDTVDVSNLQRQIIHNIQTVHTSKCQSAQQAILQLNPNVNVRIYEEEFTVHTAPRIISDGFAPNVPWNIVIDGSDNFPTKYLIKYVLVCFASFQLLASPKFILTISFLYPSDICAIHGLAWIYSAILGFEGQVAVFNVARSGNENSIDDANRSPDYRDLLPTPPLPGDVPSCAEGGVLGILPGAMGCIQATEAIKYILNFNRDGLLIGRVLCYNALTMKFTEIKLQRNTDRVPITALIDYQGFCSGPKTTTTTNTPADKVSNQSITPPAVNGGIGRTIDELENLATINAVTVHDITPKECCSKLMNGWTPYVIDVRLKTEHEIVHLPFTDCVVPYRNIKVSDVPIDGDVLLYCKGGVRGTKAGTALINAGIDPQRIYNLKGGIMQWQKDIDSSMPRY
jgi:sulfur-carrier protein adenylyltransferase/sulfurtransferase